MTRSIWKGPFTDLIKIKTLEKKRIPVKPLPLHRTGGTKQQAGSTTKKIKIWSRRSQIMPLDVGKEFLVHNGRTFVTVKCTESMCSHKWGEFAVTRKKPVHKFNKKRQLHKPLYKKR